MSSDPKGPVSEPTPLSAATRNNVRLAIEARQANGESRPDDAMLKSVMATVDAQATEIAALKGALEKARDWMGSINDYESLSPAGHAITRDAIAAIGRVLAGKEAHDGN